MTTKAEYNAKHAERQVRYIDHLLSRPDLVGLYPWLERQRRLVIDAFRPQGRLDGWEDDETAWGSYPGFRAGTGTREQ